jgi:hypothetical protein
MTADEAHKKIAAQLAQHRPKKQRWFRLSDLFRLYVVIAVFACTVELTRELGLPYPIDIVAGVAAFIGAMTLVDRKI